MCRMAFNHGLLPLNGPGEHGMIGQTEGFSYSISAVIKEHELHENAQASVNQTPHKGLESSSAK
jgi:hypothetical protein